MARKAPTIILGNREKALMEKELNRKRLEKHYDYRIKIILYSKGGMKDKEISTLIGYSEHVVGKWRLRWHSRQEILQLFEEGVSGEKVNDRTLMNKIKEILSDSFREGRPSRISQAERDRIVALACGSPESMGLPFTNRTHEELAKQARKKGIQISTSQTWLILKKRLISP
jgi:transposase